MRKTRFSKPKPQKAQPAYTEKLNFHELILAVATTTSMQYLIEKMDELKTTSLYNQTVRNFATRLQESLKSHLDKVAWADPAGGEVPKDQETRIRAMEQQEEVLKMFHNLFMSSLSLDYVHESTTALFWMDVNSLFIKYDMPLAVGPNGVIQMMDAIVEGGIE